MLDFFSMEFFSSRYYFFNPDAFFPLLTAVTAFLLGLMVFLLNSTSFIYQHFFLLCASAALSFTSYGLILNARFNVAAALWSPLFYLGLSFIPAAALSWVLAYAEAPLAVRKRAGWITRMATIGLLVLIFMTQSSLGDARLYTWADLKSWPGIYAVYFLACWGVGLFFLWRQMASEKDPMLRRRHGILFVIVALFVLAFPLQPFSYIHFFYFVLMSSCFFVSSHQVRDTAYQKHLEAQVQEKTKEVSRVLGELKATQLRLLETGKISTLASLSAGILHQISQPITAIHGFVRFMKKEMKETDPFYRPVKLMEEQSVYLKDMLEDLMDLVRHREIKKESVNINSIIKKATDLLTDELRIRRVNWDLVLAEELPSVYADGVHVQQVFMNIVVNALEAMHDLPKGRERSLRIVTRYDEVQKKVAIMFKDSGPGISTNDKDVIFEPFFSTKAKGSGIGLALCKDLIAEHGGEISAENNASGGATFTIKFPAEIKG